MTGIFSDADAAERAVRELIEGHFNAEDISILVADREGSHRESVEFDTGIAEGATGGAAIGGALGALGAALVATGVIAAPGFIVFAAGPLLASLQGAVAGAAVGLEVGALGGMGFWKEEAHIHADALQRGGVIVAVPAVHEHAESARKAFVEAGADAVQG